jgi:putative membrane protein
MTPLLKGPILFLAILGGAWQQLLDPVPRAGAGPFVLIVLLALIGGVMAGVASWLRTTYWIDERELRIDTGLISRQSRRIRIDRLQGVDIVQPFVARIFGHAQLNFDVASGDTEGSLAFLTLGEAEKVRSLLLERRDLLRGAEQGAVPCHAAPVEPGAAPSDGHDPEAARPGPHRAGASPTTPERVLARLDLGLLARSTVLSFEMVIFVVGAGVTGAAMLATGSVAAAGLAVPALLGGGIALFRQINANHGHVVSESPAGLVLRRGLLSLSRQTVALPRVQGVRISEPLLWRPFGWARLEISVAGSSGGGDQQTLTSSVLMPVADRATVRALAVHALRGLDPDGVQLVPAPRRARWRAPISARWQAVGGTPEVVVSRRGLLTRRTDAVPTTRVQSLGIVQGPWSRRLGLADLEVHSPIGTVRVVGRFRDHLEARAVLEQLVVDTRAARMAGRPPRGAGDVSQPTPPGP